HPQGRDKGRLAGANGVTPNLSPSALRKRYSLYDNKKAFGAESAEGLATLTSQLEKVNLFITTEKGDYKNV
ncbi:MAG: [FeFe] hydrogenase H-cluster radical SAM maturase HydE, partial [Muribaculaceae bacterium]|nr:[FeFe] hydrogenase H-cluster radical SAM maturase HydE [Muribaculaceae bacterium]